MIQPRREFDRTIGISFLMFIVLGLPDGLLGLAWPSMREEFGLSLDAIGGFLLSFTLGFMLVSFNSGMLVGRLGVARLMILAALVRGGALIGVLLAPSWVFVVGMGAIFGAGTGLIDSGLNTYVADYRSNRLMNWLHAAFGVGATIGPLLMTILFSADISWRWGYGLVGAVQLAMIGFFVVTYRQWRIEAAPSEDLEHAKTAPMWRTLRLPLAWFGIGLFFIHSGLEASAGQWSYTLFTEEYRIDLQTSAHHLFSEGRGITPEIAGVVVSIYWGSFTLGRVLFGFIGDRWRETTVLRALNGLVLLGAAMVFVRGADVVNFLGLTLLGVALAPMFPMLINSTAARMHPRHVPNAIGFQVGAAAVGGSILPWLIGALAENTNLEVIGLMLVVIAATFTPLYELMIAYSTRRQSTTAERIRVAEQI